MYYWALQTTSRVCTWSITGFLYASMTRLLIQVCSQWEKEQSFRINPKEHKQIQEDLVKRRKSVSWNNSLLKVAIKEDTILFIGNSLGPYMKVFPI